MSISDAILKVFDENQMSFGFVTIKHPAAPTYSSVITG